MLTEHFWAKDLSVRAFSLCFFLSRTKMFKETKRWPPDFSFQKRRVRPTQLRGAKSLFLDNKIYLKFWIKAVFHVWLNSEAAQGDGEMSLVLDLLWLCKNELRGSFKVTDSLPVDGVGISACRWSPINHSQDSMRCSAPGQHASQRHSQEAFSQDSKI